MAVMLSMGHWVRRQAAAAGTSGVSRGQGGLGARQDAHHMRHIAAHSHDREELGREAGAPRFGRGVEEEHHVADLHNNIIIV